MRVVFIRHSKPVSYHMANKFSLLHDFLSAVVRSSAFCAVAILLVLFAVLKGNTYFDAMIFYV